MKTIVIFLAAVVLYKSVRVCAQNNRLKNCLESQVFNRMSALPNSDACISATEVVLVPLNTTTDEQLNVALNTFCSYDCGKILSSFLSRSCGDTAFSFVLNMFCLRVQPDGAYCRNFYPDVYDFSNLEACNSPDSCSSQCASSLSQVKSAMGCCFNILYNISNDYTRHFMSLNYLTDAETILFGRLSNPALWSQCNVELIGKSCGNTPFPGEMDVGTCAAMFMENLPHSCASKYETVFELTEDNNNHDLEAVCAKDNCGPVISEQYQYT